MFAAKWVICVFSYNRGQLLVNLVGSARTFYPEFDIVIFDDSSNDAATRDILHLLQDKGVIIIGSNKRTDDSKHGGLYAQMNMALNHAINQGYDYAYFVQDDMQFLWRDDTLEKHTKTVFQKQECVMCNYNFLQKILKDGIDQRLPAIDAHVFSFAGNGVADTGVIDIKKASLIGLHFPEQSEHGNGKYWYNKGYRMYWLPSAHLAWVPWPTTYRHDITEQRKVRNLLPLNEQAIERIKANTTYAYLEDYTSLQGLSMKPYWYTNNPGWLNLVKIYTKYFLKKIF